ncbi:MAG: LysM peptidoglycan-binding domain-containing protein [Clostridia bacterium]|nr:LysM peptidoglycan-binding domain-containing protein [Clostridia bacterium]
MKLKIVNIQKFIRSLVIIGISVFFLLLIGFNHAYSKGEVKYKEEYIYAGDTLWSIAEKEAKNNKYYENKDVRNIVIEIKDINHIESGNLKVGQKIKIPTF